MPDPGRDAQQANIQASLAAAAARNKALTDEGIARGQTGPPVIAPVLPDAPAAPPEKIASWAVVAYCSVHRRWGCSFNQREAKRAYWEASSAACGDGAQWCPGGQVRMCQSASTVLPGYLMVCRDAAGNVQGAVGRSRRLIERQLRRQLGAGDVAVVLLVSVRRGVLVNDGLDLTVGWAPGKPGAR